MTQGIGPFFSMTQRIELFFFSMTQRIWTLEHFYMWLKELNLLFYKTQRVGPFFSVTQRIEPFFIHDSKNWTFFFFMTQRIGIFFSMTLRIEPFFHVWFTELNLFVSSMTQNWTFFSNMTQRIEPFLKKNERDTISRAGSPECKFEQATCAFRWTKFVIDSLIHLWEDTSFVLAQQLSSCGPVSRGWLVTNTCRSARLTVCLSLTQRIEPSFLKMTPRIKPSF